jgi:1,4-dihydroxy-2-naphthoyl-CoA hydrolase
MNKTQLIQDTEKSELLKFLGVKIMEAGTERVVLTMEVTPKVHQYVGIMNGGVSVLLSETAASIGAVLSSDLEKVTPVGIEINANHLRAASKGIITVEAKPLRHGRTVSVWNIEIKNDREKLVCVSRITILLQNKAASQPPK